MEVKIEKYNLKEEKERNHVIVKKMPPRNNILMQKRAVPKQLQLPDSRVFYAKNERIKRANLLLNVRVQRTCKKR